MAAVKTAAKEHHSYWKGPRHDYSLPLDVEDLEHLVRWARERAACERPELSFYLEYELRLDPDQVAEAMAKEWPEANGAK